MARSHFGTKRSLRSIYEVTTLLTMQSLRMVETIWLSIENMQFHRFL